VILEAGVAAMVLALVGCALWLSRDRWQAVAYALLAGGGAGNLWDRLAGGAVTDFLNLGIGPVRTGIFNVADLAIVAGVVVLLVKSRAVPQAERAPP
jgi:signal peptidase II